MAYGVRLIAYSDCLRDTEWTNTVVVVTVVVVDIAGRRNNGLNSVQPINFLILSFFILTSPLNCHMLYIRNHFRPITHNSVIYDIEFV